MARKQKNTKIEIDNIHLYGVATKGEINAYKIVKKEYKPETLAGWIKKFKKFRNRAIRG